MKFHPLKGRMSGTPLPERMGPIPNATLSWGLLARCEAQKTVWPNGPRPSFNEKGRHPDGLALAESDCDLPPCGSIGPQPPLPDENIPLILVAADEPSSELLAGDGGGEAARQGVAD